MRAILMIVCLCELVGAARAAERYEYAMLHFSGQGIRWTDKAGARAADTGTADAERLFATLSGEDAKRSRSDQACVLVLNGLSRAGWELVHVTDGSDGPSYLLRRPAEADVQSLREGHGGTPAKTDMPLLKSDTVADERRVPLSITGGHETDPRDHGRPVVLIASALGVPSDVFRETFTHVHPAGPGAGGPTPDEARANKAALLRGLGPYGVTNDRLDEVSNFYRYAAWEGGIWRNRAAAGYATVKGGVVTGVTLTDAGAGYTSEPMITVPGFTGIHPKPTLAFTKDFASNGSIGSVTLP